MNIYEKLAQFVKQVFKTTVEIFLEALKLSPNAQGYVSGSITENSKLKEKERNGKGKSTLAIMVIFTLESLILRIGM